MSALASITRRLVVLLSLWLASASTMLAQPYFFTTLAGNAGYGAVDGQGSSARFRFPQGTAVDTNGNVYVADTANSTIRKITPAGNVSTLAGLAGNPGSSDGAGSAARFNSPQGVAVDSQGNVFVADTRNSAIRRIAPDGTVSTVAGKAGTPGSMDGTNNGARFRFPAGIAVDRTGNLYVADTYNDTVRLITPQGTNWIVTTPAGSPGVAGGANGTNADATFNLPSGIAVDGSNDVYVADTGNSAVRKMVTTGTNHAVTTFASLNLPAGIAVDGSNNVYVADAVDNLIRKINPGGTVSNLAGLAGVAGSSDGPAFPQPSALLHTDALNPNQTNFYEVDVPPWAGYATNTLLNVSGSTINLLFNQNTKPVAGTAGNVLLLNNTSGGVVILSTNGATPPLQPGESYYLGVQNLGANPATFSIEVDFNQGLFNNPSGVAVDAAGNVYVADDLNCTIRKISGGFVSTLAGRAGGAGSNDGKAGLAHFTSPQAVTVDTNGNVYVADTQNDTIREITPAGTVSTLAGLAGSPGNADGTDANAQFNFPMGIAVDASSRLYVADAFNHTIRQVVSSGNKWAVSTFAGVAGTVGGIDGPTIPLSRILQTNTVPTNTTLYYPVDVPAWASYATNTLNVSTGTVNLLFNQNANPVPGTTGNVVLLNSNSLGGVVILSTNVLSTNGTVPPLVPAQRYYLGVQNVGTNQVPFSIEVDFNQGLFNHPSGVAVDAAGSLYVADTGNSTIRQVVSSGSYWTVRTLAGIAGTNGSADGTYGQATGTNSSALFKHPGGIALDTAGNVYVADTDNNTIRELKLAGANWVVSTLAGKAGFGGSADGTNNGARFASPQGIAVDGSGNLYVADVGNNTIRRLTPVGTNWVVTTVAGLAGVSGSSDGTGTNALFSSPSGIATGGTGALYVADTGNDTIRVGRASAPSMQIAFLANQVVLSWPASAGASGLETSSTLSPAASWIPVVSVPTLSGTNYVVTNSAAGPAAFYRLRLN